MWGNGLRARRARPGRRLDTIPLQLRWRTATSDAPARGARASMGARGGGCERWRCERGRVRGQVDLEEEARAPSRACFQPERRALRLHQLAADGEPEPGA